MYVSSDGHDRSLHFQQMFASVPIELQPICFHDYDVYVLALIPYAVLGRRRSMDGAGVDF